ncbi:MAG: membrane integrity-associated transporter subunit PqiC [Nitrospirae bacterium]|nr:MAG: membrane integrity-associated transporter subunit PqiC [Nitrospirota bacterium]
MSWQPQPERSATWPSTLNDTLRLYSMGRHQIPKRLFHGNWKQVVTIAAVLGISAACVGCAETQPSRFYLLQPVAPVPPQPVSLPAGLAVGLGPIELPEYLDRPQMVTFLSLHEVHLAEFHNWVEPLSDMIPRVLAENLTRLLNTEAVFIYPWKRANPVAYHIPVTFIRFDASQRGEISLVARWAILTGLDRQTLLQKRSEIHLQARGNTHEALAAALSEALARFSQELAKAVQALASRSSLPTNERSHARPS